MAIMLYDTSLGLIGSLWIDLSVVHQGAGLLLSHAKALHKV